VHFATDAMTDQIAHDAQFSCRQNTLDRRTDIASPHRAVNRIDAGIQTAFSSTE
jgi:hypothetical protein